MVRCTESMYCVEQVTSSPPSSLGLQRIHRTATMWLVPADGGMGLQVEVKLTSDGKLSRHCRPVGILTYLFSLNHLTRGKMIHKDGEICHLLPAQSAHPPLLLQGFLNTQHRHLLVLVGYLKQQSCYRCSTQEESVSGTCLDKLCCSVSCFCVVRHHNSDHLEKFLHCCRCASQTWPAWLILSVTKTS